MLSSKREVAFLRPMSQPLPKHTTPVRCFGLRVACIERIQARVPGPVSLRAGGVSNPVNPTHALSLMRDLQSSGLVREDVITRIADEHQGALANQMLNTLSERRGERVYIEYQVDPVMQAQVIKTYPEFELKFGGRVNHPHAVAAIVRRLNQMLIARFITTGYIDIGGNLMSNLGLTEHPVHVVQPVLSSRDVVRVHRDLRRVSHLVTTQPWSLDSLLAFRDYLSKTHTICRNIFETCDFQCPTAVAIDSVYDIHPDRFLEAMVRHGVKDAYITFIVAPECLIAPSGCLSDIGAIYQVVWRSSESVPVTQLDLFDVENWADLDIVFHFAGDPSTAYRHRYDVYAAWMAIPASIVLKGVSYSVEFTSVRLSTAIVHIFRVTDGIFDEVAPRPLFLGRFDDYYTVTGYCTPLQTTAVPVQLSTLLVKKKLWDDLMLAAVQSGSTNVTVDDVLARVRSLSASMFMKVIINGHNILEYNDKRETEQIFQVHALLVAYMTHVQCKQRSAMMANINVARRQALWSDAKIGASIRLGLDYIVYAVRYALHTITPWLCLWDIAAGIVPACCSIYPLEWQCVSIPQPVVHVVDTSPRAAVFRCMGLPNVSWRQLWRGIRCGVSLGYSTSRVASDIFDVERVAERATMSGSPTVSTVTALLIPAIKFALVSMVGHVRREIIRAFDADYVSPTIEAPHWVAVRRIHWRNGARFAVLGTLCCVVYWRRHAIRHYFQRYVGIRGVRLIRAVVVTGSIVAHVASVVFYVAPLVRLGVRCAPVVICNLFRLPVLTNTLLLRLPTQLRQCLPVLSDTIPDSHWLDLTTVERYYHYVTIAAPFLSLLGKSVVMFAVGLHEVVVGGFGFDGLHVHDRPPSSLTFCTVLGVRVLADLVLSSSTVSGWTWAVTGAVAVNMLTPITSPRSGEIKAVNQGAATLRSLMDIVDPIRVVRVSDAANVLVIRGGVLNVTTTPLYIPSTPPVAEVHPVSAEYQAGLVALAKAVQRKLDESNTCSTTEPVQPEPSTSDSITAEPLAPRQGVASRLLGGLTNFVTVAQAKQSDPWALRAVREVAERIDDFLAEVLGLDIASVRLYVPRQLRDAPDEVRLPIVEYGTATYCAAVGAGVAIKNYLIDASVGSNAENRPNVRRIEPKFGDGQVYYQHHPDGTGELVDESLYDPDGGLCYTSDALDFFHAHRVALRLDSSFVTSRLESARALRVTMVQGVPGCGKTTLVVKTAMAGDLVITETKAAEKELVERLSAAGKTSVPVFTSASVIINLRQCECKRLLIDEATLIHAGLIRIIAALYHVEQIVAFGDYQQIAAVSFVPDLTFQHEVLPANDVITASVTFRLPQDIVRILRTVYPQIQTTSKVERSYELMSNLSVSDDALYITFTQLDKAELIKMGVPDGKTVASGRRVLTAHEAQGQSVRAVVVVRLTTHQLPIFRLTRGRLNAHMIVAISRHTESLRVFTKATDDDLTKFIAAIPSYLPSELPLRCDALVVDMAECLRDRLQPRRSLRAATANVDIVYQNNCWWLTIRPMIERIVRYLRVSDDVVAGVYRRIHQYLVLEEKQDALAMLVMAGAMLGVSTGYPVLNLVDNAVVMPYVQIVERGSSNEGRLLGSCSYKDEHWTVEYVPGSISFDVYMARVDRVTFMLTENTHLRRLWFSDPQRAKEFTRKSDELCTVVPDRGAAKAKEIYDFCRTELSIQTPNCMVDVGIAPGGSAKYHVNVADSFTGIHFRGKGCLPLPSEVNEEIVANGGRIVTLDALPRNSRLYKSVLDVIPDGVDYLYCDIGNDAIVRAEDQAEEAGFILRLFDALCNDPKCAQATIICKLFIGRRLFDYLYRHPSLVICKPKSSRTRNLELYVIRPQNIVMYTSPAESALLLLAETNCHLRYCMTDTVALTGAGVLRPSSMRPRPEHAVMPGYSFLPQPRRVRHTGAKQLLEERIHQERWVEVRPVYRYALSYYPTCEERVNNCVLLGRAAIGTLQHLYDSVLPGCSLSDGRNDPALIACGSVSADCENKLTINRGKLLRNNLTPFVAYEPALRTAANYRRRNTTVETIIALVKRNFDVQMVAASGNLDAVVARAITATIDLFCIPGAVEALRQYYNDPVAYDEQSLNEWITRTDGKKATVHVNKDLTLRPQDVGKFEFMLKTAPKVRADVTAPSSYQKLQTICAHPVAATSLFSPIFGTLVKRFQAILKPNVIAAVGYSLPELEAVITHFNRSSSERGYVELDLSSFDKSQQELAHMVKMTWYRILGMPPVLADIWDLYHRLSYNRGISAGITFWTSYQHKSGDASTTFGNTLVTMTATADIVRPQRFDSAMFIGDDVIISGCATEVTVTQLDMFQTRYNVSAKLIQAGHGYFCGHFLVECGDGCVRLVADPVKRLEKLGRKDILDAVHLDEVRTSTLDLTRHYRDCDVGYRMRELVQARYSYPVDTLLLLPLIHEVIANRTIFNKLFKVVSTTDYVKWKREHRDRNDIDGEAGSADSSTSPPT